MHYICAKSLTLKVKTFYFIPAVLWVFFIYWLLVMPSSDIPSWPILDTIDFDKWVHCGLFGTLVFLFSFPLKKKFPHYIFLYLFIAIVCLGYGIAMEFVQKYFTNGDRDYDVWDMVADGVGCLIGFLFIQWQLRRRSLKSSV